MGEHIPWAQRLSDEVDAFLDLWRKRRWLAIIFICFCICFGIFSTFGWFRRGSKIEVLTSENKKKNEIIIEKENDLAQLRHENDKLHRENLHLQEMLNPVKEFIEEFYPNLDITKGLIKLRADLEDFKSIISPEIYHYISSDIELEVVQNLKKLQSLTKDEIISFVVVYQNGCRYTEKIANDIKDLLREGGFKVEHVRPEMRMYSKSPPYIDIECTESNFEFLKRLIHSFKPYLPIKSIKINMSQKQKLEEHISIFIGKDPQFNENGSLMINDIQVNIIEKKDLK